MAMLSGQVVVPSELAVHWGSAAADQESKIEHEIKTSIFVAQTMLKERLAASRLLVQRYRWEF
jgi:hypothetical protein